LEGDSRHAKFVIRNWGFGPAKNVNMEVQPVQGNVSPLVDGDYDIKLPAPRLSSGSELKLLAGITGETGAAFDVNWTWEDKDGTKHQENTRVSL
jgi:hypothetical protein